MRKQGNEVVGLDMTTLKRMTEESRDHLFIATGYPPDQFCELHHELAGKDRPPTSAWLVDPSSMTPR